jgi:hypothetical protein
MSLITRLLIVSLVVSAVPTRTPQAETCQSGGSIQQQLDAVASTGGEVSLGCGCWILTQTLTMPSYTILEGQGRCTVLYIAGHGTGILGSYEKRNYGLVVRDLAIDGKAPGATKSGYIAIDFRNVSAGRVRDVYIDNVETGVLITATFPGSGAYYNVIEDAMINASVDGIEILTGGNENIIRGGKIQSIGVPGQPTMKTGIWLNDVTNVKISGTSIEGLCRSDTVDSPCSRGIRVGPSAVSTKIDGVRVERADIGVHLEAGSVDTVGIGPYCSDASLPLKADSLSYRWIGSSCGEQR